MWRQGPGSTLAQVMACCLTAPRDFHLRTISQAISPPSIAEISLKIIYTKFHWNLPGVNELTHQGPMLHLCVYRLGHHQFSGRLVAVKPLPKQNPCWRIIKWPVRSTYTHFPPEMHFITQAMKWIQCFSCFNELSIINLRRREEYQRSRKQSFTTPQRSNTTTKVPLVHSRYEWVWRHAVESHCCVQLYWNEILLCITH